jgi:hypothetical protein
VEHHAGIDVSLELEGVRCGLAGQDCERGEGHERAGISCLFFLGTWLSGEADWTPGASQNQVVTKLKMRRRLR